MATFGEAVTDLAQTIADIKTSTGLEEATILDLVKFQFAYGQVSPISAQPEAIPTGEYIGGTEEETEFTEAQDDSPVN